MENHYSAIPCEHDRDSESEYALGSLKVLRKAEQIAVEVFKPEFAQSVFLVLGAPLERNAVTQSVGLGVNVIDEQVDQTG